MKRLFPILLIASIACLNSFSAYATSKTSKEIFAEVMKQKAERKKHESLECRHFKKAAKLKYKSINVLITIAKQQFRLNSEVLREDDLLRITDILIRYRKETSKIVTSLCENAR